MDPGERLFRQLDRGNGWSRHLRWLQLGTAAKSQWEYAEKAVERAQELTENTDADR